MKIKYVFLSTALTIALALPMFGQHDQAGMTKTDMKKHDMSGTMGKPTVDATVEGLHMKVWLMTQMQYKSMMNKNGGQMMQNKRQDAMGGKNMKGMHDSTMMMGKDMKGMNHDGMGMDQTMMAGTHRIMLDVKDASLGKEIANASAKVLLVSPSKKNSSIDLQPMMGVFGNALTLDEKGKYKIAVSVNVDGVSKTKSFEYTVK